MTNEIKVEGETIIKDAKEGTEVETTEEGVKTEETVAEGETPEAKKARLQGSFKRFAKDLQDLGEDPLAMLTPKSEKQTKTSKKSNDLDYGEKAFLVAGGIKIDELSFAQDLMKKTGLSIDEFLVDDFAQTKLKGFREAKISSQAIPSGTKRSSNQVKDSVEYHLEKYENGTMQLNDMPFEMRSKVLTAKISKDKKAKEFSFTPSI